MSEIHRSFQPGERNELEELSGQGRYRKIARSGKGIGIVADPRGNPNQDCYSYVLGVRGRELVARGMEINSYPDVDTPREGDYVLYYGKKGPLASHLGILQENGMVISKWGKGPVYEHPLNGVPASYGSEIRIVRPPQRPGR